MDKQDNNKTKTAQYKENLRVLSTTTPEHLVETIVKGYGFTKKTPKKQ